MLRRGLCSLLLVVFATVPGAAPAGASAAHHHRARQHHRGHHRHRHPSRPTSVALPPAPAPVVPAPFVPPPAPVPAPLPAPAPIPVLGHLQVPAREFSLSLSRPVLDAGPVAIQLANFGEDAHDLSVQRTDGSGAAVAFPAVGAGGVATQTLTLAPGTYRLWCTLPGHDALGMHTTLTVR